MFQVSSISFSEFNGIVLFGIVFLIFNFMLFETLKNFFDRVI